MKALSSDKFKLCLCITISLKTREQNQTAILQNTIPLDHNKILIENRPSLSIVFPEFLHFLLLYLSFFKPLYLDFSADLKGIIMISK